MDARQQALQADDRLLRQVQATVEILGRGGVVAVPTDTLYGLAAAALNEAAVGRVFRIKGRQREVALPLLLADPSEIQTYAVDVPDVTWPLVDRFVPGPLTLVLKKADAVPGIVSGGLATIALRVPDHPVPRRIVTELGQPITGTSANRSGQAPSTSPDAIRAELGRDVDLVVDGGSGIGLPSTVLDLSGDRPRVVREGAVSSREIEEVCGEPVAVPR